MARLKCEARIVKPAKRGKARDVVWPRGVYGENDEAARYPVCGGT